MAEKIKNIKRFSAGKRKSPRGSLQNVQPKISAGYLRGEPGAALGGTVLFGTGFSALRDRADDVRAAYIKANSRANDAALNSGWIAGVIETIVTLMIGTGLRLNAKPDMSFLGWDEKQAADWARHVEKRWELWASQAYEVDVAGRFTMAQLEAAAIRQWFATGEIVGRIVELPRHGAQTCTKVQLIPSHWLSQETTPDNRLFQGVYQDEYGLAAGYLFEFKTGSSEVRTKKYYPARDAYGRPRVFHIFDGAAGQVRGITPLAPALKIVRQYGELADATLTASMIHAVFAATIESDYPTDEVMAALRNDAEDGEESPFRELLSRKAEYYKNVDIDLANHGKIAHLLEGEKLQLHSSGQPNSTYEAFANFLLREIAACLGVMPSDLTGDFRGDTYSSVRMGIAKKWPLMEYRRRIIPGRFAQTVYEAWLEEEIDAGRIELPGGIDTFVANRSSLLRGDWRGPAKPQADDLKAAKAYQTLMQLGVVSQEMVCNDLGVDHEDVHEQLAREKISRTAKGLPEPVLGQNIAAQPEENEE